MVSTSKLSLVTRTRADSGLSTGLIGVCSERSDFQIQLVASRMHLDDRFGNALNEIVGEGFEVLDTLPMLDANTSGSAMVKFIAGGITKFVDVYDRLSLDLVVILTDRYAAVAQAASLMEVPDAHIQGGEAHA